MKINIFVVINQISKYKAKIYACITNACIPKLLLKKIIVFILLEYKNFLFLFLSIRRMNLSLDELRLIAQAGNISDYESKSKEDLIKVLSETNPKPKPEPKIEIKPK